MNLAECIRPHLPFARRFARALSGSQVSGDAYVAATLEAIIADPSLLRPAHAKMDLYRLLPQAVGRSSGQLHGEAKGDPTRRLQDITPRPRQAFLSSTWRASHARMRRTSWRPRGGTRLAAGRGSP